MTILLFTLSFLLAFLTESGVEYIFGTPMDKVEKLKPHKWLLMYIALVVGVGLCFYYKVDLIALLPVWLAELTQGKAEYISTPVGMALTGLAIGRGSDFLHQLITRFKPAKPQ